MFLTNALIVLLSSVSFAAPGLVKVSTRADFKVTSLLDGDGKIPASGIARDMALAKKAFYEGDKARCVRSAQKVAVKAKSVAHWATLLQLRCGLMDRPRLSDIEAPLARIKKNSDWILNSHGADQLREQLVLGMIAQANLLSKTRRNQAWGVINEALSYRDWVKPEQQAELYSVAGEISFVNQDLLAARDYFQKSLKLKDSEKLRSRLDSILLALNPKAPAKLEENKTDFQKGPRAPKEELAIFNRMNSAVASKDYISALEDGVSLLEKYPRGENAKTVEEQISGLFMGMISGNGKSWNQVKSRVIRTLKSASGDRLLNWAEMCYRRGSYREAFELAEAAAEKLKGQIEQGDALVVAAEAAQASGELRLAEKHFKAVTEKFSGGNYYFESLFRFGTVHFRAGNYSEAVAAFERLLSSTGSDDFEYRALYWTWRSLQNLKVERAKDIQDLLVQKFPMTLYGMRALAEKSDSVIKLSQPVTKKSKVVQVSLRLLPHQRASWDRLGLLLHGGWLDEAQIELDNLPDPQTAEEFLVYSKLYSLARGYVRSIRMMNKAWELNPEYAYQRDYLLWIFPDSFKKEILKFSAAKSLEPIWVRSLIRQESAFNPRAVSRSNALGLMQLLPSTGAEVAAGLKMKNLEMPESLFRSDINVELGTTYLKKMLDRYKGQLPFALAAYNAGPTRFSRWLDSSGVKVGDSELWMEELPWSETSYYVKAILRNILIFQVLDQGQLRLSPPIWQISAK